MQDKLIDGQPIATSPDVDMSIVTSCYNSAPYVQEFFKRHQACLTQLGLSYEFIFVNDGSPDPSRDEVLKLIESEKGITLVDLSKNYGQHAAMFAGLSQARGKLIYAVDSDLEEAPENILEMYEILQQDKEADVVYGYLPKRQQTFLSNLFGWLFFTLLNFLSDVKIPRDQGWQRIMSRRYVQSLLRYSETETLPAGLMALTGYKQIPVPINKTFKGQSNYTFGKKMRLALDSIISFSSRPLVIIGLIGFAFTFLSFIGIFTLVFYHFMVGPFFTGWASVIISIYLMGGLILIATGVLGVYLSKVFNQVKNRPMFNIRDISQS